MTEAVGVAGIREDILRAAEAVISDVGMRNATTRAIARRAGCAEGSIYRHFSDRHALFLEIAKRQFPTFLDLMSSFRERAGTGTVQGNLEELAAAAMEFYRAVIPMTCGMMAERPLLERQRTAFLRTETGPIKAFGEVEAYLRAEQELGRICPEVSPSHVARMVLGVCFGQVFVAEMMGPAADVGSDEEFARVVVRDLTRGIAPRRGAARSRA